MSGKGIIEQIKHYQKDIERCPENTERMIRCIQRLYVLPVLVEHLKETGVGRSVNSLRKYNNGEVGNAAKALVAKWKAMVAAKEAAELAQEEENKKRDRNHRDSQKDKSDSHSKDKSSDRHKRKHVENSRSDKHHKSRSHSEIKHDKRDKEQSKKHRTVVIKEESPSEKSSDSDSESDSSQSDREPIREESESENSSQKSDSDSESSSDDRHKHKSSHKRSRHESDRKHSNKEIKMEKHVKKEKNEKHEKQSKKSSVKIERNEDGSIDQGSGASFADALLGVSYPPKKKKKLENSTPPPKSSNSSPSSSHKRQPKNLDFTMPEALTKPIAKSDINLDISSMLPEILPTYKPLPHVPEMKRFSKSASEEDALISVMTTKNLRTKVYSGGKTGTVLQVPSLYELCLQLLLTNIDALEYTGGVPFDILKPLLQKLNAGQLFVLEHHNPYLVEETDELWQFHCKKDFRGQKLQEMESYRDLYLRCMDEREKKLKAVTTNVKHSIAQSVPVRTAKLAYIDSVVKPPRNVARNQARYGTASSSRSSSEAKQQLLAQAVIGAHTPGVLATTVVPAPPHSVSRSAPIQSCKKKQKAPLMARAIKLIKVNRYKR